MVSEVRFEEIPPRYDQLARLRNEEKRLRRECLEIGVWLAALIAFVLAFAGLAVVLVVGGASWVAIVASAILAIYFAKVALLFRAMWLQARYSLKDVRRTADAVEWEWGVG